MRSIQKTDNPPAPEIEPAPETVLAVKDLTVRFATPEGEVEAVNGVSLDIKAHECVGIVGESGSGKSQLFLSLLGLIAQNGTVTGSAAFGDKELIGMKTRALNKIRGSRISMIFQDPMTSLTPHLTIGRQMTEVLTTHMNMSGSQAQARALEMLGLMRIPNAKERLKMYPHEFSGGMRQRVMIAMALLCEPEVLIADEPTTALDVTVQAQILDLFGKLKRELGTAIVMITHDLGVVAGLCDRVNVMYGGRFAETGDVRAIFSNPQHPYTRGLLSSMPRPDRQHAEELIAIPGQPPNLQHLPPGCPFQERCSHVFDPCKADPPPPLERASAADQHAKACHLKGFDPSGNVIP